MAITARTIISNARTLLQDTDAGGIRWIDSELIAWLNEATTEVVRIHPHANAMNSDLQLVIGTRQRIPDNGVQLLNVQRNVSAAGAPGRVIRIVDHDIMNIERPDWHIDPQESTVKRYTFDPQDPMTFYVYPPSDGTAKVAIVYSAAPTQVVALDDLLPIPDIFAASVTNYICFRAWLKQVGDVQSEQRAGSYLQLFNQSIGVKKVAEDIADPNIRRVI